MFTVVGAGFGIYGYLPALVETFGEAVILPREYEAAVMARPELARYRESIRWAADIDAALGQASGVVIAVRPASQPEVLLRCRAVPGIGRLVLEKPLAVDPAQSGALLEALSGSGKRYRVGYTLLDTYWCRDLAWPDSQAPVRIDWTFMAHHFANDVRNWKRMHSQGGGALRFYGIHLLALLGRQGYDTVAGSTLAGTRPEEPSAWAARFGGPGLPDCEVRVDSRSAATGFTIASGGNTLLDLRDPFDLAPGIGVDGDRRIPVLASLLGRFAGDDAGYDRLYQRINALWHSVEEASRFQPCGEA